MYKEIIEKSPEVSRIMNILSHEKRLSILCMLSDGPKNISELTKNLDISQSLVSQFTLKMRDQGILSSEKKWKEVYYTLDDQKIAQLLVALKKIYC